MAVTTEYTSEENAAINDLRQRMANLVSPEMYDDKHLFYRFLKARDFKLDLAEAMLRKSLLWRKELGVDRILTEYVPLEALVKYFPGNLICFDKEGCPIRYFDFGHIDAKGIRRAARFSDMEKYLIHVAESDVAALKEQSIKLGKEIPGSIYIFDFKDFCFSQATDKKMIEHMIFFSKMYQDNYPERLKAAIIINVSPYFTLIFNIIKIFLASAIIKKTHFYSSEEVKDNLLKLIDPIQLPAFLGGTKTDPDGNPLCNTFVNHAGKIPSKYYIRKGKNAFAKTEGVKKLVVPSSSQKQIEFQVLEPGSMIEWEFEIKSRDVAFGLFYKEHPESESRAAIVPSQRLSTQDLTETGIHKCETPGTYFILFDNSYSWWRSKEIYYKTAIRTPNQIEEDALNKDQL